MNQVWKKNLIMAVALLVAFTGGLIAGCSKDKAASSAPDATAKESLPAALRTPHTVNAAGSIEVAFSPKGGGAELVIKAIKEAKKSVQVQAYSFTNSDIAQALAAAKKSGVEVRVILDKSQESEKYTSATFLANAGIPVKIDHDFAIAHNKIMIIDGINVVTGSFNFTKAAEEKNTENVLVLRGNKALAELYLQNWQWRWDGTEDYKAQ